MPTAAYLGKSRPRRFSSRTARLLYQKPLNFSNTETVAFFCQSYDPYFHMMYIMRFSYLQQTTGYIHLQAGCCVWSHQLHPEKRPCKTSRQMLRLLERRREGWRRIWVSADSARLPGHCTGSPPFLVVSISQWWWHQGLPHRAQLWMTVPK